MKLNFMVFLGYLINVKRLINLWVNLARIQAFGDFKLIHRLYRGNWITGYKRFENKILGMKHGSKGAT